MMFSEFGKNFISNLLWILMFMALWPTSLKDRTYKVCLSIAAALALAIVTSM